MKIMITLTSGNKIKYNSSDTKIVKCLAKIAKLFPEYSCSWKIDSRLFLDDARSWAKDSKTRENVFDRIQKEKSNKS
jgi:hypothetical protein